ncbi:MAG TPA: hypothetical protein VH143_29965 [Kofleriaceae bacterium]|nr:hypothetical protein [Kofleriaceae bacterium]
MSGRRHRHVSGLGVPAKLLLVVAACEVAIDRVAVPLLRPATGAPPSWHTALDYAGLFLFYFTGTLAAFVALTRCLESFRARRSKRDVVAHGVLAIAIVLAALPLAVDPPEVLTMALEIAFAVSTLALVVSGLGNGRGGAVQIGLCVVAVPLVLHGVNAIGTRFIWPDSAFDAPATTLAHAGVVALSAVALVSPYVFAPRPFARAVTRPTPVLFAMSVAAFGAIVARTWYPQIAKGASLAIGVELDQSGADPRLALYLLAVATLVWTLVSCAQAASPARRSIGAGIAFVVLGGYAFRWPDHYLLPLLGLALISEATNDVRDEELSTQPIATDTPPIADAIWGAYIAAVKTALEPRLSNLHTLTTRGDGNLATTLLLGDSRGVPVRVRVDRIETSVVALDVIVGREIDEVRGATFCVWAIPNRGAGVNPSGPPAAPVFKAGDAAFEQRFKSRGNALAFQHMLDAPLRARATATLDGWLAYWDRESLRYRVYPGRGAPLDHPLPLSDLATGRTAGPERLQAVIELLVEIAAHGIEVRSDAPMTLTAEDV